MNLHQIHTNRIAMLQRQVDELTVQRNQLVDQAVRLAGDLARARMEISRQAETVRRLDEQAATLAVWQAAAEQVLTEDQQHRIDRHKGGVCIHWLLCRGEAS